MVDLQPWCHSVFISLSPVVFGLDLWLMVLPGILLGARIGPWLNKTLGRRRILLGFATLLVIEFTMTFMRFVVLA